MSVPSNRSEFKDYCLRKLGHDVIELNMSEEQIEDRIDEALHRYQEHHFDSYETIYLSHQLTAGDVANTYIQLPYGITGVTRMFSVSAITGSYDEPLSLAYQIRASDVFFNLQGSGAFGVTMLDYYLFKRHMTLIEEILSGTTPIRFNKHQHKAYLDGDWNKILTAGTYVILEAQSILPPDDYPSVWSDLWLQNYATYLMMQQWGRNLSKYTEVRLPGGIVLNGPQLVDYADNKLETLEIELRDVWSAPPNMMIG